ncbi:EamA domain-containing membrane protein RarD [Sphingomonas laterariae]|uniref:EamA domain-containing membrane protein RarD n=1 Tax=Edaphosphingomonas laterariae TaxID=861865 RepID=A0A239F7H2_9SPHN|nr:DMT family transporter [Sphingomonas laterariae]SNS52102.1 EamA domain-containing membrane protein RarD [Sphingomonas laterariae]
MHDSDSEILTSDAESHDKGGLALAFAAMVGANIALAFGPLFVRLSDVGPVAAGFWRLALAVPLLLLLSFAARQHLPLRSGRMWAVLALGGLFFAADLGAWHVGILHTTLANATLFGNIASLTFPIYGFIVARMMPGRVQAFALGLAAVGAVLLMGRSYQLSPQNLVGDLLCIAAGILYTFYLAAIGMARGRLQPLPTIAAATVFGTLPLLVFAWATGEVIWPDKWTPLLLLAIGSQVIGQGLMVYAIGHLPPLVIGIGLLIQPVVAAIVGVTVYDERLGAVDMIGAAAIAIALVLVRRPDRKSARPGQ